MSNVTHEIPLQCIEDRAYTDDPLFDVEREGCEGCEFIKYTPIGCIGGQTGSVMGHAASCEKGYFRENV